MNEHQLIEAALQRRFARVPVPECPQGPCAAPAVERRRLQARSRRFAYATAILAILVSAGVAAQASGALRAGYEQLRIFQGSSKPLPPMIHKADRLTIAQAQQQVPFTIVEPAGLPADTTFQYAHVVSVRPVPRVSMMYQARISGKYYRININETTAASGPAVARLEAITKDRDGQVRSHTWTLPLRRWKHGTLIMEMIPQGLPASVVDRIVRENTR